MARSSLIPVCGLALGLSVFWMGAIASAQANGNQANGNQANDALANEAQPSVAPANGTQAIDPSRMFGKTLDGLSLPPAGGMVQGFRTTVEVAPDDSLNYLPVSISIQALGTITADRNLVYRFETIPDGYYPPQNGMVVEVPVTLGQGTKNVSLLRYLPKWSVGRAFNVSVMEDGKTLPEYEGQIGVSKRGPRAISAMMTSEYLTDILRIRDQDESTKSGTPAMTSRQIRWPEFAPTELGTDWRGYQRFDVILISAATLEKVSKLESRFDALRGWVLLGGTLIVDDADDAEAVFEVANFAYAPNPDDEVWITSRRQQYQMFAQQSGLLLTDTMIDQAARQMSIHEVAAGRVIVVNRELDIPTPTLVSLVTRQAGYRASPVLRRGVEPMLGNRRFFNWLIPGVAQPPVYTFMGLLTVFVVMVGPIAYRRTSKIGRSYLMFVIAPILALATTAAMFGYGIIADGFGTVARVRQLTWVDGVSGDASERTRATYFAGIRPAAGLRFSPDAEVYGAREVSGVAWQELGEFPAAVLGEVKLSPEEQRFSPAFLPSRQQKQFVVHQPRNNLGYVRLRFDNGESEAPTVANGFDFMLKRVVVRDRRGDYWSVEMLQPGESLVGKPLEGASSKVLGRMYREFMPQAAVRKQATTRRNRRYDYDVLSKINEDVDPMYGMITGIFETWLQRKLQTEGDIPESHFVATADVSRDVLAVEDCELTESVRYVFGTLR